MTKQTRRQFTLAFKKTAVRRVQSGQESTVQVARELEITPPMLRRWVKKFGRGGEAGLSRQKQAHQYQAGARPLASYGSDRYPASSEADGLPTDGASEESIVTHLMAVLGRALGDNQALRRQLGIALRPPKH